MDIYNTYYMLAAVKELALAQTFFKNRYFPTNVNLDIFGTSKVLADFKEGTRKRAPFVLPRVGSIPIARDGFSTYELEPPHISVSMPLTFDHLKERGFGESLVSQNTPEEREKLLLMGDLNDLSDMIARTEEWMACQTMLENGCTMRHQTDQKDIYRDVNVKFYDGEDNPALYTPTKPWTHTTEGSGGKMEVGSWYNDIVNMIKMLTRRGLPAKELLVSSDVGEFLMEDLWVQKMLDSKFINFGMINPQMLTDYVAELGTFIFGGRKLTILVNDGTFEDENGRDTPYLESGSVIVTAPDCGRGLYGAVTQLEKDGSFHTYSGTRVPLHVFSMKPPVKETQMTARPLMVPKKNSPWSVAKKVFG